MTTSFSDPMAMKRFLMTKSEDPYEYSPRDVAELTADWELKCEEERLLSLGTITPEECRLAEKRYKPFRWPQELRSYDRDWIRKIEGHGTKRKREEEEEEEEELPPEKRWKGYPVVPVPPPYDNPKQKDEKEYPGITPNEEHLRQLASITDIPENATASEYYSAIQGTYLLIRLGTAIDYDNPVHAKKMQEMFPNTKYSKLWQYPPPKVEQ